MVHQSSIESANLTKLFPPRPEIAIHPKFIADYDNLTFAGQLKLNGACGILHLHMGSKPLLLERNGLGPMTVQQPLDYWSAFNHKFKSAIIVGEYMNKNKKGFDNKPFNHKFVVNEIIALNGLHLIGTSFDDRMAIIDDLMMKPVSTSNYLHQYTPEIYRVSNIESDFSAVFDEYTKIDMVEGLIVKKKKSNLYSCYNKKNLNDTWQFKFRKPTNSYRY